MLGQPLKISMPFILLSMTLYLLVLPLISYPVTTFLKPIPILLLILFTLQLHPQKEVMNWVRVALGCALVGDMVLTLPTKTALNGGIFAFMITQALYISIFLKNWQLQKKQLALFVPVLLFVLIGFYYLWPYFGLMKLPITLYLCLLILMVFCAFQTKRPSPLIRLGALVFLLSDFILALDLFVLPHNSIIAVLIMLFYYMAQLLLVLGIIAYTY
jgi:uncharacterized membrane protein YhhN